MKRKKDSGPSIYDSEDFASFRTWWEPFSTDEITGASEGGQPEAWRWWARPDPDRPGKWERRRYGEIAKRAFKNKVYRDWWRQWKLSGEPHGGWVQFLDENDDGTCRFAIWGEPFISNCLPLEEQQTRLGEVTKT